MKDLRSKVEAAANATYNRRDLVEDALAHASDAVLEVLLDRAANAHVEGEHETYQSCGTTDECALVAVAMRLVETHEHGDYDRGHEHYGPTTRTDLEVDDLRQLIGYATIIHHQLAAEAARGRRPWTVRVRGVEPVGAHHVLIKGERLKRGQGTRSGRWLVSLRYDVIEVREVETAPVEEVAR